MDNQRFIKIFDRQDRCDIPKSSWRPLTENAYLQTWKGILLEKDPMQIAAYPMLINELQPKTIIELGRGCRSLRGWAYAGSVSSIDSTWETALWSRSRRSLDR